MMTVRSPGFSLVPALFLLVVLGVLGAVAVRVNMIEQQTVVLTMQSSRALAAARTGIERAAYLATNSGLCTASTFAINEGGLNGFTISTNCSATTHAEGPNTVTVYRIESFSWSGSYGTPSYVSRRIRTSISSVT